MKKLYTSPELEISKLTAEDILDASETPTPDNEIFIGADQIFGG